MKKHSIRKEILRLLLAVSGCAVLLIGGISLFSLQQVRSTILAQDTALGEAAAESSRDGLITQMRLDLTTIASANAKLVDARLEAYTSDTEDLAARFAALYNEYSADPEAAIASGREIRHTSETSGGEASLQLDLATEDIDLTALQDEELLLSRAEDYLRSLHATRGKRVTSIYFGTESGMIVSFDSTGNTNSVDGVGYYNYFDSTWYGPARDAGKTIFTDTYLDSFGRGAVVTCATPVYDSDGVFRGVAAMDIRLEGNITRSVLNNNLGEGSYAMVVESDGDVIAWSDMDRSADGFTNIRDIVPEAADMIALRYTGITPTESGDYVAFSLIKSANWMYVAVVPSSVINTPADAIRTEIQQNTDDTMESINETLRHGARILSVALAVIVLFVAAASTFFARRLTRPILQLKDDVRAVSREGNLKHRAAVMSQDEVGELAQEFNEMTDALDAYFRNLAEVTADKNRIETELNVATQIQASMLPTITPYFEGHKEFRIAASMDPAKEVGGDFYDFYMVDPTHLAIVMADVSGKGVPAALFMVIGKTLLKEHTLRGKDLGETFTEVNQILCESNGRGMFITAFEAVIDLATGEMSYVNAGHEVPLLAHAGEDFNFHKIPAGFVLAGMEGIRYKTRTLQLQDGDRFFEYTDGVAEAINIAEEAYGTDRLAQVLSRNTAQSPAGLLDAVKADVTAFVGEAEQFDDLSMLCVEYHHVSDAGGKV